MKAIKYTYTGKNSKFFTNGECYDVAEVESPEYITKDDKNEDRELSKGFLSANFTLLTTKPVYTQEMHEAGELPGVGMEVMIRDEKRIILLDTDSDGDYITINKYGVYEFDSINQIEPLEPPVKLVDGKAYQFIYDCYEEFGRYNSEFNCFCTGSNAYNDIHCTNIQPLTVGK